MAIEFDGKGNIASTTEDGVIAVKLYSMQKQIDEKDKEIERLKELCDKYEEEHKTTFEEWKKNINIIKEVREYINEWLFEAGGNGACMNYDDIKDILDILDKENK